MKTIAIGVAVAGLVAASLAFAADGGVKRTELQRASVPGTKTVAIVVRAEIEPGSATGFHTHPGDEIGVVVSGQMTLQIRGEPDKIVKTGDSFRIPAGVVHNGLNSGTVAFTGVQTYVVDSEKPLATPAP